MCGDASSWIADAAVEIWVGNDDIGGVRFDDCAVAVGGVGVAAGVLGLLMTRIAVAEWCDDCCGVSCSWLAVYVNQRRWEGERGFRWSMVGMIRIAEDQFRIGLLRQSKLRNST